MRVRNETALLRAGRDAAFGRTSVALSTFVCSAFQFLLELLARLVSASAAPFAHEGVVGGHRLAAADNADEAIGGERRELAVFGDERRRVQPVAGIVNAVRKLVLAPLLHQTPIVRR